MTIENERGSEVKESAAWFTIETAPLAYPGVLTQRLLRTLVTRREISFSRSGRRIVFAKTDIESYLLRHRQEAR